MQSPTSNNITGRIAAPILAIFLIVWFQNIMNVNGSSENLIPSAVISLTKARQLALQGLEKTPWIAQLQARERYKKLKPAVPLLVQRVDRSNSYYYLVPFNEQGQTILVVSIDAVAGHFKQAAKLSTPGRFPNLDAEQALKILQIYLKMNQSEQPVHLPKPILQWRPCRQSQSPFEPFWFLKIKESTWYIDQSGKVWTKLEALPLKGGGVLE